MRVDNEIDLARISVNRFEPRAHFFAGLKAYTEQRRRAAHRVVQQDRAGNRDGARCRTALFPWVLDKKDRDRHRDVALAALHQMGELASHRATSQSIDTQIRCLFPILQFQ